VKETTDSHAQAKARKVLQENDWGEDSISRALNPTPKQAAERGMIPMADMNPEQWNAIELLKIDGWAFEDIAKALPVPASEIVRQYRAKQALAEYAEREEERRKRAESGGPPTIEDLRVKKKIADALDLNAKKMQRLLYLRARWHGAHPDDWKDYEKKLKRLTSPGTEFVKAIKRPFGFVVKWEGFVIRVYCNSRVCGWKVTGVDFS